AAESAGVTRKIARSPMRIMGVMLLNGKVANRLDGPASGEASPAIPCPPVVELIIDAPPKTVKAKMSVKVGTPIVVKANARKVRPREIFAIKVPTNGVQAIHQAQ